LAQNPPQLVKNVTGSLSISESADAIADFVAQGEMLVQQSALQGAVYQFGTYVQTCGSTAVATKTTILAKATGTTVGGIFFHSFGSLGGANIVGRTCHTIATIFLMPMRFMEMIYNTYIANRVFQFSRKLENLYFVGYLKNRPTRNRT
jgi:hypothetical protein